MHVTCDKSSCVSHSTHWVSEWRPLNTSVCSLITSTGRFSPIPVSKAIGAAIPRSQTTLLRSAASSLGPLHSLQHASAICIPIPAIAHPIRCTDHSCGLKQKADAVGRWRPGLAAQQRLAHLRRGHGGERCRLRVSCSMCSMVHCDNRGVCIGLAAGQEHSHPSGRACHLTLSSSCHPDPPALPLMALGRLCRWALQNVWREGDVVHMT